MGVKDLEDLKKLSMLRSQIDGISVESIMSADFPTVSVDDRIADALAVMKQSNYQDVPVVDGSETSPGTSRPSRRSGSGRS